MANSVADSSSDDESVHSEIPIQADAPRHGSSSSRHRHGNASSPGNSASRGYQYDMLDPYFMHPSDNPSIALVSPPLIDTNYHAWSRSMLTALRSKNKIRFIDGSLQKPLDTDRYSLAWDRCNTMIISWITNSLDPEIAQSVMFLDTADEVWKELKDRYYQGDVFRISDLQEEIYSLKQGDSSITNYYTRLKKLWQELHNFRPLPTCVCDVKCVCHVLPKIREYREGDCVIRFLKGLNEQYSSVRSQIMLMEPLPKLSKVFSLLIQQERQFAIPLDNSKFVAQVSGNSSGRGNAKGRGDRGGRSSGGRGRGVRICSFCDKTGHTVDTCFKKHGYPPHYQKNASVNNCATKSDKYEDDSKSIFSEAAAEDSGKFSFTPDQHKGLLALLQSSTTSQPHNVNHLTTIPSNNSGFACPEDDWCS